MASLFGTPLSRWAGEVDKGIKAYEGRGDCFVTTELYGVDSPEVALLSRFRDIVLLPHNLGTRLVAIYYCLGPEFIPLMRKSKLFRGLIHALVALSVWVLRRTVIARFFLERGYDG
jgi:hypothetical protein